MFGIFIRVLVYKEINILYIIMLFVKYKFGKIKRYLVFILCDCVIFLRLQDKRKYIWVLGVKYIMVSNYKLFFISCVIMGRLFYFSFKMGLIFILEQRIVLQIKWYYGNKFFNIKMLGSI